jgi:hypothetical protein
VRIRLYLDEDSMSRALVQALQARGVDVENALGVGLIERSDLQQLEYAAAHGRTLYSANIGDFHHLHTEILKNGRAHAGIILARQSFTVGEQLRRLLNLLASLTAENMKDRLEFLSRWG